jgi:hypothetical protein|tara:strand:+ start:9307 stop:10407 length:1101 start_codon:yes stop_codon:yes gene_type:complete
MSNDVADITRKMGPQRAITALERTYKLQRPVFLWGPPGIGKSDIVAQLAKKHKGHLIDVRLALWDPTDIKGIPYFDGDDKTMKWAPPAELPSILESEKHEAIFLFLDEMPSAAPSTQAAAYQLVLNRKVGTYTLPDNVYIIAAGNRESDRGVTYRMPSPLANRFLHIEMEHNFDDFLNWGIQNQIHPDALAYLESNKDDLYDFDPEESGSAFATPRSWSFVSQVLYGHDGDESLTTDLVAGCVGTGLALKFNGFREHHADLPKPIDVLTGRVTELKTDKVSAMYALTLSMCYELKDSFEKEDEKEFNTKFDYFVRFMLDNFEVEMVVMGVKVAVTKYGLQADADESPAFEEFHNRFGELIKDANGR